jgi:NADH:ubiquinone oxidoreductase subunit 5 (subunit L)/multisubunit Na+/H+ antiporter MnhA subunit
MSLAALASRSLLGGVAAFAAVQGGLIAALVGAGGALPAVGHILVSGLARAALGLAAATTAGTLTTGADLTGMGGLLRHQKGIGWAFLIGSVLVVGLPPFGAFWTHASLLRGAAAIASPGLPMWAGMVVLLSGVAVVRLAARAYLGSGSRTVLRPDAAATAGGVAPAAALGLALAAAAAPVAVARLPGAGAHLEGLAEAVAGPLPAPWLLGSAALVLAIAIGGWGLRARRQPSASREEIAESALRRGLGRAYWAEEAAELAGRSLAAVGRAVWTLVDVALVEMVLLRGPALLARLTGLGLAWLHDGRRSTCVCMALAGIALALIACLLEGA